MAKGAKRQKIKEALSPVRDLVSPRSPPMPESADNSSEVLDDLFAELDSRDKSEVDVAEAARIARDVQRNESVNEGSSKRRSRSKHEARQARKAAELAEKFAPVDKEAEAKLEFEAKEEERVINSVCRELNLEMHEINPDGHCLFSAIADQLSLLDLLPASQADYATTRSTAAKYMLDHPDDFMPFLPSVSGEDGTGATDDGLMTPDQYQQYCKQIAETGVWGGEPEIQALSRAFAVSINVVQGGTPRVVVHEPGVPPKIHKPVMISYHRRMYGLGEHYNSLRPLSSRG